MKKCACGNTAWYGNHCYDCREATLNNLRTNARFKRSGFQEAAAPNQHAEMRKPMSDAAARKMGETNED